MAHIFLYEKNYDNLNESCSMPTETINQKEARYEKHRSNVKRNYSYRKRPRRYTNSKMANKEHRKGDK